jgi:hypothetical protein
MSFKAGEGGALKLCKDCRHYRFTFWMRVSGAEPECERTRKDFVHPVSGRIDVYRSSCGYQRGRVPFLGDPPDPKSICGKEARYFESKPDVLVSQLKWFADAVAGNPGGFRLKDSERYGKPIEYRVTKPYTPSDVWWTSEKSEEPKPKRTRRKK